VLLVLRLSRLGAGIVTVGALGGVFVVQGDGRLLLALIAAMGVMALVILSRLIRLYR
jgi:hypothetical protein